MPLVFGIAGILWGLGAALGTPRQARWLTIGLLYIAVLAVHVVLPDGNALRAATGTSAAPWLILGAGLVVVLAYRAGLSRVRARVVPPEAPRTGAFSAAELERYARHITLREIGGPGQRALKEARVLVVGAGGLGAPVLLYLGAAGVGTIGVIDDDRVEAANLQRQIVHADARIGMPKVFSAEAAIRALNPFVTVRPYNRRLTAEIAPGLMADYDLVIDGSDSFATRDLVNRAAVAAGKPLLAAAITQWEGQIGLFDPCSGGPCYACVFPHAPAPGMAPTCAEAGVAGPLPGILGAMLALEAVKVITGAGTPLLGRLVLYDALDAETRTIRAARRPDCPVCGPVCGAGHAGKAAANVAATREPPR